MLTFRLFSIFRFDQFYFRLEFCGDDNNCRLTSNMHLGDDPNNVGNGDYETRIMNEIFGGSCVSRVGHELNHNYL